MMEWIAAGLAFGFVGSVHCVGMCGPLALGLPGAQHAPWRFLAERLVYNSGRVVTYTLLGALAGTVGLALSFAGLQRVVSVAVGGGMMAAAVVPWVRQQWGRVERGPAQWFGPLMKPIQRLYARGGWVALLGVGLLNGLLPCGFVYAALATAVAAGSLAGSMAFMAGFGLGTFPAMLAVSLAGRVASATWRERLTRFAPIGLFVVGVLLVLRGTAMGAHMQHAVHALQQAIEGSVGG
ncbi:sulfite exporter TauE/SafE family protein [Salisaeta longa]|uniref:sulfite exporter TauE/SafE family protein n=1 Tax=Salisaeta longa TaxID=503170 RepID=UPI0006859E72|nr:sulfite exporter TauE/SafE family protein [Salisaeta longa]